MGKTGTVRKKEVSVALLSQAKLERLRKLLRAESDAEAINHAVDFALAEEEIKRELARVRGKGSIRQVFE